MSGDLTEYFEARHQMRLNDQQAVLRGLTKRETQLVREAAVMGYVRGMMAAGYVGSGEAIPPDSDVLALVITCCLGFPDLYPAMKRAWRRGESHTGEQP